MKRVSAVLGSLSALLCLGAILFAPGAGAQLIVVGQTAPPGTAFTCSEERSYVEFQSSVAAGNSYVFPTAGRVTSWSVMGGASPASTFGVKIFRPVIGNSYKIVGGEVSFSLGAGVLNTYPLSIDVEAGDILGTQFYGGDSAPCLFETGSIGDRIRWDERIGLTNSTVNFDPENIYAGARLNASATLLPPPTISSFGPTKGTIKGEKIVIYGTNFSDVRSVKFGTHYAKKLTVDSEGQITAYAPATFTLEKKLPVSVTTGAGVATSTQTYSYIGCKVPSLSNKKLKAAKRALKKAGCKLGKVTLRYDATARGGKVLSQHPSAGTIRLPGTKVKLTLY